MEPSLALAVSAAVAAAAPSNKNRFSSAIKHEADETLCSNES
ncbi:hypothetical protein [Zooshikella ganghwensis]|nr:hypothetical protein [Zooshikella ganghwensis]